MNAENSPPSAQMRESLLKAMLNITATEGWNRDSLRKAAHIAQLSEGELMLAAPDGVNTLLEHWADLADAHTEMTLAKTDLSGLRIRDKIALGVRARISYLSPHKEAARHAAQALAAPWRATLAPRFAWRAADTIWSGLGDTSTDGNWYSKRTVLSGVIASTLSHWLSADSEDDAWTYLDARIENVMQFEKAKAKFKGATSRFPNPLDLLKYVPGKGAPGA